MGILLEDINLQCPVRGGNPPNGNILVGGGKETKMGFP